MGSTKRNKEINKKTDTDLKKELVERRKDLNDFRFDVAGTQSKDSKHQKGIKKDIARIMTELNKRTKQGK